MKKGVHVPIVKQWFFWVSCGHTCAAIFSHQKQWYCCIGKITSLLYAYSMLLGLHKSNSKAVRLPSIHSNTPLWKGSQLSMLTHTCCKRGSSVIEFQNILTQLQKLGWWQGKGEYLQRYVIMKLACYTAGMSKDIYQNCLSLLKGIHFMTWQYDGPSQEP